MGDVSVIIPTYNRARDLPLTLGALAEQTLVPYSVMIVDSGSTDGTEDVARCWTDRMARAGIGLIYQRKEPEGPAAARNLGWRAASTEFVAFVDSDVTIDRVWIEACRSILETSPLTAAVGGQLLYAHRPELLNSFGGELSPIGLAWDAEEGEPADRARCRRPVLWASCSAILVRRSALIEAGGFEETFFYGFEDSDLGWRLNLLGRHVTVISEAKAFHRVGQEIGLAAPPIIMHTCKNRLRSLLTNWGAPQLVFYAPAYLAYAFVDLLLRPPRLPKAQALWWNVVHLPSTLARRREIQRTRRVMDSELADLFAKRWFPRKRLSGLRRRPVDQGSGLAQPMPDDRV
jgi:GT2 family glycosyltransferase